MSDPSTKKLILHVELPLIHADDWPEAFEMCEVDPTSPRAVADYLTDEIASGCSVTLLLVGDEGGPLLTAQDGQIVGAQVVDR